MGLSHLPTSRPAALGRWRRPAIAAIVAALAVTVPAASAAVPGYERITAKSSDDSERPKQATARCKPGKRVVGIAGQVYSYNYPNGEPYGEAAPDMFFPNQPIGGGTNLTEVTVHADEDANGTPFNWSVTAQAICAAPLPGLELADDFVFSDSPFPYKKAYADCPAGKKVIGAAADVIGGGGRVVLEDVTPNEALTSVSVTAWEAQGGTDQLWGVTAYAICAQAPPGLERVESYPQPDHSWTMRFVTAKCPQGKVMLGVGGDISHGGGQGGDTTGGAGQVLLRGLIVLPGATPSTDDDFVYFRAYEDEDGTTRVWRPGTYAICATA
jgi:hypothetical protein